MEKGISVSEVSAASIFRIKDASFLNYIVVIWVVTG
jgi:hypothetical protein